MSDWAMVEAASEDKPGKVRHVRSYMLEPGMAHVYNEGDLHSPRRDGPTRLIRVEGQNMDHVRRLRYEKPSGRMRAHLFVASLVRALDVQRVRLRARPSGGASHLDPPPPARTGRCSERRPGAG